MTCIQVTGDLTLGQMIVGVPLAIFGAILLVGLVGGVIGSTFKLPGWRNRR